MSENLSPEQVDSCTFADSQSNENKGLAESISTEQFEAVTVEQLETVSTETENTATEQSETEKYERLTRLPIARIRTLIKADQDVTIASQESVFLITKSTELFIESLAKELSRITQSQKRKTIYKKDIDSLVEMLDEYAFLEGVLD